MTDRKEIMGLAAIAVTVVALALMVSLVPPKGGPGEGPGGDDGGQTDETLKKFASQSELSSFIKYSAESGGSYGGYYGRGMMLESVAVDAAAGAAPSAAPQSKASEYSTTNIQVEGVDEADIVKNDGKYIYVVSGNKVVILDAYPPEDAEILSSIEFGSGTPSEIYINGDRLIVFIQDYNYDGGAREIAPYYYGSSGRAIVRIYDISDREDPALEQEVAVKGSYFDSRMIGGYVYVVVNEPIYYRPCYSYYYGGDEVDSLECLTREIEVPEVTVDGEAMDKGFPDVYYWDIPDNSYRFTTVLAVNTQTDESPNRKFFVMGSAQDMYVSMDNIYVTRSKWMSEQELMDRVYDEVVIPNLPEGLQDEIADIEASDKGEYTKKFEKLLVIKEYIANLDGEEAQEFQDMIGGEMEELREEFERNREQTVVSRISIDGGEITPKATGSVPGSVLNQFSMDEYDGNFRIATTTQKHSGDQANHLYVMNPELEVIGKIEDIAPGESIYSVRFMGEKAYMVTFKRVDPLFVIDLSDPDEPELLGKLKIPGYSDYLHPYDENHLIGIGKEVDESVDADKIHSSDAVYYTAVQGVKLAIFDVTDVEHPVEMHKEVIGDRGTESEATQDHKAFLFDRSKGLLVIPMLVAEVPDEHKDDEDWKSMEGEFTFQGAYVYDISLEGGFSLRGRVTHLDDDDDALAKSGYYFSSPLSVKRSLYMDDVLYTISDSKVVMSDLNVPAEKINEVELPYEGGGGVYYPYPEMAF